MIYKQYGQQFWEKVKYLNTLPKSNLRILLFAVYDQVESESSTPIKAPLTLGSEFLFFDIEETKELITNYNSKNTFQINLEIIELLQKLTDGHIGIVSLLLQIIYDRCKYITCETYTTKELVGLLLSFETANSLRSFRATPKFDNLNPSSLELLKTLLLKIPAKVRITDNTIHEAHDLMKRYIVRWVDGECKTEQDICFISPFIHTIAFSYMFSSARPSLCNISNMNDFILECIKTISTDFVIMNLGLDTTGKPLEMFWQMEMYRVATSILPVDCYISPNIGHQFGTLGLADFYVNDDKKWLIEITREDAKLQEHIDRFKSGGIYSSIPFNDYAIIDFRKSAPQEELLRKVWYVNYNEDRKSALVRTLRNGRRFERQVDFTISKEQASVSLDGVKRLVEDSGDETKGVKRKVHKETAQNKKKLKTEYARIPSVKTPKRKAKVAEIGHFTNLPCFIFLVSIIRSFNRSQFLPRYLLIFLFYPLFS